MLDPNLPMPETNASRRLGYKCYSGHSQTGYPASWVENRIRYRYKIAPTSGFFELLVKQRKGFT